MIDLSKSDKINRTCKGICKTFHVKKPVSGSRYGSGQGHCQICNTWIDHSGCHMNDGTAAPEESVGWFCNCCNYRVRQKPRNKRYKEKLRNEEKNANRNDIHTDSMSNDDKLTKVLSISKGQAIFLKKLSKNMPKLNERKSFSEILKNIPALTQFEIKDNWEDLEGFLSLATDYLEFNKISTVIYFEKFKDEIGIVPNKAQFLNKTCLDEDWINKEFESWEHFLDLLQYDPWYRDNSKNKPNNIVAKSIRERQPLEYEKIHIDNEESNEETVRKVNELKSKLLIYYKSEDLEENSADYSYVEMFQLLEKYLKILPNKPKYGNIKNLI